MTTNKKQQRQPQQDPSSLLALAQQAIARRDFTEAANLFTTLITEYKPTNPAVLYLSRSTCYLELKEFKKAVEDAELVLKAEEVFSVEEFLPGCFSTHEAALGILAKGHKELGNVTESEDYQKRYAEQQQKNAFNSEKATAIKEEGNVLFKKGDYKNALVKYQEACRVDPGSEAIWSNLCQVFMKLNRLDEALWASDKCTTISPTWPKGWYRKGTVLMKMRRFVEAVAAFQAGLTHSPDDTDLKRSYMEASKLTEKIKKNQGGFDKQFMGMMMDLKAKTWSVGDWAKKHKSQIRYSFLDEGLVTWEKDFQPHLSNAQVRSEINKIMRIAYADFDIEKQTPVDAVTFTNGGDRNHVSSYFIPNHPLLSALIFYSIVKVACPNEIKDWDIVFSLTYNPSKFATSHSFPFLARSQMYWALVGNAQSGKESGFVIDPWGWFEKEFEAQVGGPKKKGKGKSGGGAGDKVVLELRGRWFEAFLEYVQDTASAPMMGGGGGPPSSYTCSDSAKLLEFVETFYKLNEDAVQQEQKNMKAAAERTRAAQANQGVGVTGAGEIVDETTQKLLETVTKEDDSGLDFITNMVANDTSKSNMLGLPQSPVSMGVGVVGAVLALIMYFYITGVF